jgi:hypothetical protein
LYHTTTIAALHQTPNYPFTLSLFFSIPPLPTLSQHFHNSTDTFRAKRKKEKMDSASNVLVINVIYFPFIIAVHLFA